MNKFDELAKQMAQSVTRRQAFKKFGVGLAGMALACFGLASKAEAAKGGNCLPSGTCCTYVPKGKFSCNKCCNESTNYPYIGICGFNPYCL